MRNHWQRKVSDLELIALDLRDLTDSSVNTNYMGWSLLSVTSRYSATISRCWSFTVSLLSYWMKNHYIEGIKRGWLVVQLSSALFMVKRCRRCRLCCTLLLIKATINQISTYERLRYFNHRVSKQNTKAERIWSVGCRGIAVVIRTTKCYTVYRDKLTFFSP
jgi:hypothetical protein